MLGVPWVPNIVFFFINIFILRCKKLYISNMSLLLGICALEQKKVFIRLHRTDTIEVMEGLQ